MFQFSSDLTITRRSLIATKESAEPLAALHTAGHLEGRRAGDQAILKSLVIRFAVVALDRLGYCPT